MSLHVSSKGITKVAGHMRNLTGKTEKNGTVEAFDKAGNVGTISILLRDVDPTAEKLYRSDHKQLFFIIVLN